MKFDYLKIGLILIFLLLLAACSAAAPALEPSVQESQILDNDVNGNALKVQDHSAATALPMPEAPAGIVAGQEEVVVESSNLESGRLDQPDGEPVEEEIDNTGKDVIDPSLNMKKIDIMSKDGRIAFARQKLADELEIPLENVQLSDYKNVVWPDGYFGCPPKGLRYTPAEIPGYLIRLTADGKIYEFHGGAGRIPFQCSDGTLPADFGKEIIQPPQP